MSEESARLDKWLWAVRIFKTRALAGERIGARGVRITRSGQTMRTDKSAFKLRIGDIVTVMRSQQLFIVEVTALPERRVSAPEAAACYRDRSEPEQESRDA